MIQVAMAMTTISAYRMVYAEGRVNRRLLSAGAFVVGSLIAASAPYRLGDSGKRGQGPDVRAVVVRRTTGPTDHADDAQNQDRHDDPPHRARHRAPPQTGSRVSGHVMQ